MAVWGGGGGGKFDFEILQHLSEESGIPQQLYIRGGKIIHFLKPFKIFFPKLLFSSQ